LGTAWWVFGRSHFAPAASRTKAAQVRGKTENLRVRSDARGELREPQAVEAHFGEEQQRLIGLKIERVTLGTAHEVLTAPGRVAPDETRFAQITPRAAGVIRTVNTVVGQEVRAGEVLATVDSPEVGKARLDLYTQLQAMEVARARAEWQETVYNNALELAKSLQRGDSPEEIHRRFEHRAVGEDREKLMTAYTHYRLAEASYARKRDLYDQKIITELPLHEARAQYEVDLASYQTLMDQMEYRTKLALTQARQALRQCETAVRVAREQLRILGIRAGEGGIEPTALQAEMGGPGKTSNTRGTSEATMASPPSGGERGDSPAEAIPTVDGRMVVEETPVSAYALRAPFDGTILDRESIVPGVYVGTTHRLFTLANLSSVWVEANVHESDFGLLSGSRGGRVKFRSPAYPDREFDGEVIYTGDLVDEKSRAVKLLARADNPERLLKPGMFVEVKILNRDPRPALQIPATALLTEGESTFVYVKTGPERFERRDVETADAEGERVTVRRGLEAGEEVVVEGGYKVKAEAMRLASSQ
jgi:multidrug efflux pump subunit AcrA (membrane-fusion protein)